MSTNGILTIFLKTRTIFLLRMCGRNLPPSLVKNSLMNGVRWGKWWVLGLCSIFIPNPTAHLFLTIQRRKNGKGRHRKLNASEGKKIGYQICAINGFIWVLWQFRAFRPFMKAHFTHHPLSGRSITLLTSIFRWDWDDCTMHISSNWHDRSLARSRWASVFFELCIWAGSWCWCWRSCRSLEVRHLGVA